MVLDLGLIDYKECYGKQKDLVGKRRRGEIEDSVILAEHNALFTIGRTGDMKNVLADGRTLSSLGLEVLQVDRGGDVTYHGPGQIVAYPIIDLRENDKGLHEFLRGLEEAAIRFLNDYSVRAERIEKKTGVWVDGRKIASVGIGASNWVTFHGMSVNINCDLSFFSMINPCGMTGVEMTSLERIKGQKVSMDDAKKRMLVHLKEVFDIN